jgi:AcrR family transcriptional regulator
MSSGVRCFRSYVVSVNIRIIGDVDDVNNKLYNLCMSQTASRMPRKPARRYHHGDLPRAMLAEAVRTIQKQGIHGLTLREVGHRLGVSRTALYRHFTDKQALLTAVGNEGFRMLREALLAAWEGGGRGQEGFERMALAYVQFAQDHPAHYRVMFGGRVPPPKEECHEPDPGVNAFQVLLDAILWQQKKRLITADDPLQLARFIWAVVHGIAMLAVDGVIESAEVSTLVRYANAKLRSGIAKTS